MGSKEQYMVFDTVLLALTPLFTPAKVLDL